MEIVSLAENTAKTNDFGTEHGLSLYIKTNKNKILFDTGASSLFKENAEKLGIDLSDVDLCVISHSHYDHGGGLETFLELNSKAKIYISEKAHNKYYAKRANGELEDIGLNLSLLSNERFIFTEKYLRISDELELFSNVKGDQFIPSGNKSLLMQSDDTIIEDDFEHEQNMIIKENDKTVLLAGCAHRGIINIISHMKEKLNDEANYVIGGFHLHNPASKKSEDIKIIKQIADILMKTKSVYYTCHCTGIESYNNLKNIMGDKIQYLSTGDKLII